MDITKITQEEEQEVITEIQNRINDDHGDTAYRIIRYLLCKFFNVGCKEEG